MQPWFIQFSILLTAFICGLFDAECRAHPISHTDAWVRVGETVEVRLLVFLDDVARHQNLQPDADGYIDSATMQDAVNRHSETLLQQLKLFDQSGQPLNLMLDSPPRWKPPENGLEISTDASLKLTWKFRTHVEQNFSAITFLHRFTHESLQQPGELRLHVLDTRTKSRTDAVVRPNHPHTISLPSPDLISERGTPNDKPVVRLIISRFGLTIEFEHELSSLNRVWPKVSQHIAHSFDESIILGKEEISELNELLHNWYSQNVAVRCNNAEMQTDRITVSMLTDDSQTTNPQFTSVENLQRTTYPFIGTRAAVRLNFRCEHPPESCQINLKKRLTDHDSLTVHTISAASSSTRDVPVIVESQTSTTEPIDDLNSTARIKWEGLSQTPEFEQPSILNENTSPLARQESVDATLLAGGMLGVIASLLAFGWMRRSKSRPLVPLVLSAGLLSCSVLLATQSTTVIDQEACDSVLESLLNQTYQACTVINEEQSMSMLLSALDEELADDVFISAARHMSLDPEGNPLLDIDSVKVVQSSAIPSQEEPHTIIVDCQWVVTGAFTHWGHVHNRDMKLTGQVSLSQAGSDHSWRIKQLTLTRPLVFEDPVKSTSPEDGE